MKRITDDKGSALLIVLALMAMLTLVAVTASDRSATEVEMSYNQLHESQAFYVAEAGIKRALSDIEEDPEWNAGFTNQALGRGIYTVSIIDSSSRPALYDTVILHATGMVAATTAEIEAWLVPEINHPFSYALFGRDSVIITNNICTDSYNSDSGSYASTQEDEFGDVGSNGEISISNNATIGGDAATADEGNLVIENHATVLGDTTTEAPQQELDVVPDSEYDWAELNSNAPAGLSGSSYSYDPSTKVLTVNHHGTLTLQSGVYYFSEINLRNHSEIVLAEGAEVTIYMTGTLLLENATTVNDDGSPANLVIFSKGSSLELENATEFFGCFYGPDAEFKLENNTEFFGALVANHIILENRACFHYDRQLSAYEKGETGNWVMIAWKEM